MCVWFERIVSEEKSVFHHTLTKAREKSQTREMLEIFQPFAQSIYVRHEAISQSATQSFIRLVESAVMAKMPGRK